MMTPQSRDKLAKLHETLKQLWAQDMPPTDPDKILRVVMGNSMALDVLLEELLADGDGR